MAELRFIHSQMGAGKTAALLLTAFHLRASGSRVLILTCNDRSSGQVSSRIGLSAEAVSLDPARSLQSQVEEMGEFEHILVDEVQFLSPNQIEELADIVDHSDVEITCYGLRSDFTGHPFAGSAHLFAICDHVSALQVEARCWCGRRATHNARTRGGQMVRHGAQVLIDSGEGEVGYQPLCRRHWSEGKVRGSADATVRRDGD